MAGSGRGWERMGEGLRDTEHLGSGHSSVVSVISQPSPLLTCPVMVHTHVSARRGFVCCFCVPPLPDSLRRHLLHLNILSLLQWLFCINSHHIYLMGFNGLKEVSIFILRTIYNILPLPASLRRHFLHLTILSLL